MSVPVNQIFPKIDLYNGDVYVADYTNQTNSARKLEFFEEPPVDIDYFHLVNRQFIPIYGVNFEKNSSFVDGHKMCECLFTPQLANNKPWLMLMEMKYCEEDNVYSNSLDAFIKLKRAFAYMHDEMHLLNPQEQNIYLVVSIPNHAELEPFDGFRDMQDQNDAIEAYRQLNVKVFATNTVLIATPNYLFERKTPNVR